MVKEQSIGEFEAIPTLSAEMMAKLKELKSELLQLQSYLTSLVYM